MPPGTTGIQGAPVHPHGGVLLAVLEFTNLADSMGVKASVSRLLQAPQTNEAPSSTLFCSLGRSTWELSSGDLASLGKGAILPLPFSIGIKRG